MTEDHLYHNQSKDFSSTSFLANHTFNSKAYRESFLDLKDPKAAVEIELNLLKEQHRRTLGDLAKANSQNKELKLEVLQLTSKLKLKDQEIDDLKAQQPDVKTSTGRKLQERDMNLPRPMPVKSSFSEKTIDGKTMRSMLNNENCPEKLTVQNKALKKEIEKLAEKLRKYEEERIKESTEKYQKAKVAESHNNSLLKENQTLKDQVEKLNVEASQLKKDNTVIKRTYEDLKSRYESLETTATSNRADYSTESNATSESGNRNGGFVSKKFNTNKFNTKGFSVDMSGDDNRKLIVDIMDTYGVNSPWEIMASIQKTEKVVQMVPKLRKMLSEIAAMVLPRVGCSKDKANIELVLPAVKKLCKEYDDGDCYKNLRNKLVDVLGLDKDCTNIDIVKKVDKQATYCFQSSEIKSQTSESRDCVENTMLSTQFVKVFGTHPSMPVFKHIIKQLEEFKHFLSVIKHKFKLDGDAKNEVCLAHVMKVAENNLKDKQYNEVVHRLQNLLGCGPESIVYNIEKMMFDTKREKNHYHHKGSFVNH